MNVWEWESSSGHLLNPSLGSLLSEWGARCIDCQCQTAYSMRLEVRAVKTQGKETALMLDFKGHI